MLLVLIREPLPPARGSIIEDSTFFSPEAQALVGKDGPNSSTLHEAKSGPADLNETFLGIVLDLKAESERTESPCGKYNIKKALLTHDYRIVQIDDDPLVTILPGLEFLKTE